MLQVRLVRLPLLLNLSVIDKQGELLQI